MTKENYKRNPNVECSICSKAFYKRPSVIRNSKSGKIFCSQECYGKSCRKPVECKVCGVEILASRNSATCSRSCSNIGRTGIKYKQGSHRPRKDKVKSFKALQNRLIEDRGSHSCEDCGYNEIPAIVQMHHVIERSQGGTDDLDNLKFLCPTCHCAEHYRRKHSVPNLISPTA